MYIYSPDSIHQILLHHSRSHGCSLITTREPFLHHLTPRGSERVSLFVTLREFTRWDCPTILMEVPGLPHQRCAMNRQGRGSSPAEQELGRTGTPGSTGQAPRKELGQAGSLPPHLIFPSGSKRFLKLPEQSGGRVWCFLGVRSA